jgi:N-acetylmuramoyl-L-alanine amidase
MDEHITNRRCLGRRLRAGLAASALVGAIVLAAAPAGAASPARLIPPLAGPLEGKVIGVDPGHNGGNFTHPAEIDKKIWNGREGESCNTTGTATDGGYTGALFNFEVATDLRADLIADGAKVVMTRTMNTGVGPCVNKPAFQREVASALTAAIVEFAR